MGCAPIFEESKGPASITTSQVFCPLTENRYKLRLAEFQKEIRGQVASLNKKLYDLNKEQKHSNKLLRRVLKMLSANMSKKGQDQAQSAPYVSSSQEINVQRAESEAFKTTSPDIGAVADIGVQAIMEFLTADKVLDSNEDAETDKNKVILLFNNQSSTYVEMIIFAFHIYNEDIFYDMLCNHIGKY